MRKFGIDTNEVQAKDPSVEGQAPKSLCLHFPLANLKLDLSGIYEVSKQKLN
jgi:hypothetical protein